MRAQPSMDFDSSPRLSDTPGRRSPRRGSRSPVRVEGIGRDSMMIDGTYDAEVPQPSRLRGLRPFARDAPLCQCDQLCPGVCCGIPCCFTFKVDWRAQFAAHGPNCVVNVTKLQWVLQALLVVITHLLAFYLGRYFCFDGYAVPCEYSVVDEPAAAAAADPSAVEDPAAADGGGDGGGDGGWGR